METNFARAAMLYAGAAILASCAGGPSGSMPQTARAPSRTQPSGSDTKPSPTPFPLRFITLDDPDSTTFNRALGINELGTIVGYYGSGSPSDPSHGYQIQAPYVKFKSLDYPNAANTVPTSLSTNHLRAGYFVDSTQGHHTWGFVKDHGIWTAYKDTRTPNGPGWVDELLGINGSDIAVGFYVDAERHDQPFELAVPRGKFHGLRPPDAKSAQATGINLLGDIVGTETLSSGQTEGWLLRNGTYSQFSYPDSASTQAFGIDFRDQVVGSYVDSGGATHGYILQHPANLSERFWQSVDEPNAAGTTVINGINSHHAFVGWYVDVYGRTHGFLAVVTDKAMKRR